MLNLHVSVGNSIGLHVCFGFETSASVLVTSFSPIGVYDEIVLMENWLILAFMPQKSIIIIQIL